MGTGVLHVLAVSFKGLNQLGYVPCGSSLLYTYSNIKYFDSLLF